MTGVRPCVICRSPLDARYPHDVSVCRECELERQITPDGLTPEQFVAGSGWRLAKTMLDIPHQYTVRDLETASGRRTTALGHAEFEWFVSEIRQLGTQKRWGPYNNTYLIVGEWEYWTMGAPPAITTIINRQAVGPEASRIITAEVAAARSLE